MSGYTGMDDESPDKNGDEPLEKRENIRFNARQQKELATARVDVLLSAIYGWAGEPAAPRDIDDEEASKAATAWRDGWRTEGIDDKTKHEARMHVIRHIANIAYPTDGRQNRLLQKTGRQLAVH